MSVTVDKDNCIGCESCISICPVGALVMVDGKADVKSDDCISCGACVSECPVSALSFGDNSSSTENTKKEGVNTSNKDLWVFAELSGDKPQGVVAELLAEASALAKKSGQNCCAILITDKAGDIPQTLISEGADVVYVVENPMYKEYDTELFANAFCELISEYTPSAILVGATVDGRDLAPRISARMNTGLCADCTALDIDDKGIIAWTRPALGGNILATILCEEHFPQMGTVRPKVFKAIEKDESRTGNIINYTVKNPGTSRVEIIRKEAASETGAMKIEEAEIICSGGRGMGSQDNFKLLEDLAQVLGGAIGGSRPVVDEGWIGHPQQVGQSGKTVTPKVYFACGISGAIQHLAGMGSSDVVIAINKDPNAPIFKVAHYGIVGDVNEVLPKLIAKIKTVKGL